MPLLVVRGKRSFTYSIIILAVFCIFILGYFFHFVPQNKNVIHNNGFTILRSVASYLGKKVDDRSNLFFNIYQASNGLQGEDKLHKIEELLNQNGIPAKVSILHKAIEDQKGEKNSIVIGIQKSRLFVKINGEMGDEVVQYTEDLRPIIQPFLNSQKNELFESYLIGKFDASSSELIYQDPDLAIRSDIGLDSLLSKNSKALLKGTRDFNSEDFNEKVFFYPFQMADCQLIICGFINADEYQSEVRSIPFYFVYPLVIIFLLLLTSLPILKFYIMDSNEQVRIRDLLFFGISLFFGSCLLTLMIVQYLLWKGQEKRVAVNLENISAQIKSAFAQEVGKAYNEMEQIDKLISAGDDSFMADSSKVVLEFLRKHSRDRNSYYLFDRISWIDTNGYQRIKAETHAVPVFTNVGKRNYFKIFKLGVPYYLNQGDKRFGWQTINSLTNGGFNATISTKSDRQFIIAVATQMHSIVNVILPIGYEFCIIDDSGEVQVHSDTARNLNESLFDKIGTSRRIQAAVNAREFRLVNDITAYGKTQMMAVEPLHQGMPFSIVTLYDKGYIVPINMRILIFSLLFSSLFFIMCFLLWWITARKNSLTHPLLFYTIDFLSWILPKRKEAKYYMHASLFINVYSSALILMIFGTPYYHVNNFNIVALLVLTPLNVFFTLYCIHSALHRSISKLTVQEIQAKRITCVKLCVGHLVLTLLPFFLNAWNTSLTISYLLVQLAVNAVMWTYTLAPKDSRILNLHFWQSSLLGYKYLLTSLVICFSVLPSLLFTWYAHNQELIQEAKRQQLYLARSIRERSFGIQNMKEFSDSLLLPDYYIDSLKLSHGIYTIENNEIFYDSCPALGEGGRSFQDFYFGISDAISVPYYRSNSYSPLKDVSYDTSWKWEIKGSKMHFWYLPPIPSRDAQLGSPQKQCLHIVSDLPARFVYLSRGGTSLPLLLIVMLPMVFLFNWPVRNARQVFLSRFVDSHNHRESGTYGLIGDYIQIRNRSGEKIDPRLYQPRNFMELMGQSDEKLLPHEVDVIEDMKNGKDLYKYVWNHCTDKEKYILFDYAHDGLINYKNTKEIIDLINKGILVVDDQRLRIFSPGFRGFILNSIDNTDVEKIQTKYQRQSTWQNVRLPLLILLFGIAVVLFFTQQGIFDKLLILAGGISTLLTLVLRFFGGSGGSSKETPK